MRMMYRWSVGGRNSALHPVTAAGCPQITYSSDPEPTAERSTSAHFSFPRASFHSLLQGKSALTTYTYISQATPSALTSTATKPIPLNSTSKRQLGESLNFGRSL